MTHATVNLALLLSSAFGFMETILLRVQDFSENRYQGVIILLDRDNSEYTRAEKENFKKSGAMLVDLQQALETSHNQTIIVSQSLVHYLIKRYQAYNWDTLLDRIYKKFRITAVDDLYLLLPSSWKAPYEHYGLHGDTITSAIPWATVLKQPLAKKTGTLVDTLSKIFLKAKRSSDSLGSPQWMVYASGHGRINSTIIDLSLDEFKDFTDFLKQSLSTKLLVYSTCFGGGLNKERGFKTYVSLDKNLLAQTDASATERPREFVKYTFPYTIITLSSTESSAIAAAYADFDTFFSELSTYFLRKEVDSSKLYEIMKKAKFLSSSKRNLIENIPQIKLPYADYFSPIPEGVFNKDDIVVISGVEAQTRTKELTVPPTAQVVFIMTIDPNKIYSQQEPHTINFPLDFSQVRVDDASVPVSRVIFSNVKNHFYRFKDIKAPQCTFEKLCALFLPLGQDQEYTLLFDTITLKDITLKNGIMCIYKNTQLEGGYMCTLATREDFGIVTHKAGAICPDDQLTVPYPRCTLINDSGYAADFYLPHFEPFLVHIHSADPHAPIDPQKVCASKGPCYYISHSDEKKEVMCGVASQEKLRLPLKTVLDTGDIHIIEPLIGPFSQGIFLISQNKVPELAQMLDKNAQLKKIKNYSCPQMAVSVGSAYTRYRDNTQDVKFSSQYPQHLVCFAQKDSSTQEASS